MANTIDQINEVIIRLLPELLPESLRESIFLTPEYGFNVIKRDNYLLPTEQQAINFPINRDVIVSEEIFVRESLSIKQNKNKLEEVRYLNYGKYAEINLEAVKQFAELNRDGFAIDENIIKEAIFGFTMNSIYTEQNIKMTNFLRARLTNPAETLDLTQAKTTQDFTKTYRHQTVNILPTQPTSAQVKDVISEIIQTILKFNAYSLNNATNQKYLMCGTNVYTALHSAIFAGDLGGIVVNISTGKDVINYFGYTLILNQFLPDNEVIAYAPNAIKIFDVLRATPVSTYGQFEGRKEDLYTQIQVESQFVYYPIIARCSEPVPFLRDRIIHFEIPIQ